MTTTVHGGCLAAMAVMDYISVLGAYLTFVVLAWTVRIIGAVVEHSPAPQKPVNWSEVSAQVPDVRINVEGLCPICLDPMEPGEVVKQLRCKHSYHRHCLVTFIAREAKRTIRCPMCRQAHVV